MRYVILAVVLLGIDSLAYQAFNQFFTGFPNPWQALLQILYWSVPALAILFAVILQNRSIASVPRGVLTIVTALFVILYLSKLLTGTVMLLDDVRRLGAWLINGLVPGTALLTARLPVMGEVGVVLGAIPTVLLVYGLIRNPYRYKVFTETLRFPHLPSALDGLRIVQISDIHAGSFLSKERVRKSVEMINALEPDLVFFTGDLVNYAADEVDPYLDVFQDIRARLGVYSIVGNHDYGDYTQWPDAAAKEANFEKLKQQHQKLGWDLLLNAYRVIQVGEASVGIIGVENYSAHPRFPKYGDMATATSGMGKQDLNILLSHDPSHWDAEILQSYPWVDLMLAGHTHGFQFGIEWGDRFKWSPVQYIYRRWAGLYREGKQYLYVNRGLGFLGYPGRVGILPEITLLTLRREGV